MEIVRIALAVISCCCCGRGRGVCNKFAIITYIQSDLADVVFVEN